MSVVEKNPVTKLNKIQMPNPTTKKGVLTRSKVNITKGENADPNTKRKAEASPPKGRCTKRSAFVDITNAKGGTKATGKPVLKETKAVLKDSTNVNQSITTKNKDNKSVPNYLKPTFSTQQKSNSENLLVPPVKAKTEVKVKIDKSEVKEEVKIEEITQQGITKASLRSSTGSKRYSALEKSSDASLYESAVESLSEEREMMTKDVKSKTLSKIDEVAKAETIEIEDIKIEETEENTCVKNLPEGVTDFDGENLHDPFQVSAYAMDIFNYLKEKESHYACKDYMKNQTSINEDMRAVLVDWMVEVQETFELNHETMYLAVKMVDLYLGHVSIKKTLLQLVGATAMFIACKYDERVPPSIEDFHYICAEEYRISDILAMEINMIKTLNFDLGAPLSYRFLRRYSRCAKVQMPLLTLARYVLELSLMQYSCITFSESKLACAALFLALQMKKISGWTPTLVYYSGYELKDFSHIVLFLNKMLREKPKGNISTIRNKYSHKVFFEVAKTELLRDEDLQL